MAMAGGSLNEGSTRASLISLQRTMSLVWINDLALFRLGYTRPRFEFSF